MVTGNQRLSAAELRRREQAERVRVEQTVRLLHASLDAIDTPAAFALSLAAAGRLRRLTFSNAVLAAAQRPGATRLQSYDDWAACGRQVFKGETGVRLLAPKVAPAAGLIDPDGPQRIEALTTAVMFDVTQTGPAGGGHADAAPNVELPVYSDSEVVRVLAAAPAGRGAPEPGATTAAEAIGRHIRGSLERVDPSITAEVAAAAQYMAATTCGVDSGDLAALGFVAGWGELPAADRRGRMVEVANRARLIVASLIDLVRVNGIDTEVAQTIANTREHVGVAAGRAATAVTNRPGQAEPAPAPGRRSGRAAPGVGGGPARAAQPAPPDPVVIAAANAAAWAYFRSLADKDTTAADYLAGRSITAGGGLPVGYAPPDVRLGGYLRSVGYSDQVQVVAGLARQVDDGRVVDVFRGRIVAAFIDEQGRVAGFTARALSERGPKYLNTKATALFDKSSLLYGLTPDARARLEAGAIPVLVEGMTDVLAIAQYQPDHLVPIATCGTAFTARHAADLFQAVPQARIIVAYDSDPAGIAATVKVGQMLTESGWQVRCPAPQNGSDPADVAAERGPKVIDWASWDRARPAIYLAAEHHLGDADRDGSPDGRRTAGAHTIDYLGRDWGTDNELENAANYVGMRTGLYRPVRAVGAQRTARGRTGSADTQSGMVGDTARQTAGRQATGQPVDDTAARRRPEATPAIRSGALPYSERRLHAVAAQNRPSGQAR